MEVAGVEQIQGGMLPAEQRLNSDEVARWGDDRLVMHEQLVVLHSVEQLPFQVAAPGIGVRGVAVQHDPVPAGGLGLIHRDVGGVDELDHGRFLGGDGDADAGGDGQEGSTDRDRFGDRFADPVAQPG